MCRIKHPALDGKFVAGPIDRSGFSPKRLEIVVVMRDRMARRAQVAQVNLRSFGERALDVRQVLMLVQGEALFQPSIADRCRNCLPRAALPGVRVDGPDLNRSGLAP